MKNVGKLAGGALLALTCGSALASGPQPLDSGALARLNDDFGAGTMIVVWGAEASQAARAAALSVVDGTVLGTDESGAQLVRAGVGVASARSLLGQFPTAVIADVESTDSFIGNDLGIDIHTLETLTVPGNTRQTMYVPVVLGGGVYTLELTPSSVRSPDFRLLVDDGSGNLVQTPAPVEQTYRGRVVEIPGSRVAASIGEHMTAQVIFNDDPDDGWYIQPLADVLDGVPADVYVVYPGLATRATGHSCGGALEHAEHDGFSDIDLQAGSPRGTTIHTAEVAYDADYQFYQLNGSSQNNTIADIENIQNGINTIYERDCDVTFVITEIIVRTSSGSNPYTSNSAETLLNQFRSHWLANHTGVHRDLAHLMTGRSINGSVIGIAWLSTVCTNNGFGLSQSRFTGNYNSRISLTAHEMGHNFSAPHCDGQSQCHIMCSGLGGCNGLGLPDFGVSASGIASYAASRGCVDHGPPPNEPPSVIITTPVDGTNANVGSTLFFSVLASDPEDGDIGSNAVWTSNIDGPFGVGNGFNYSGLSSGVHTITASAVDTGGLSDDDSITLTIIGGETIPEKPDRPSATDLGTGTARVTWTDLPNETSWDVQRQERVGTVWTNLTTIATNLPANTTQYDDAAGFGKWRYRVRAKNGAGTGPWSKWRSVTLVDPTPPTAPTNMSAADLGGGSARCTWDDNSSNETGFQVQRQQSVSGSWVHQGVIANTAANVETRDDSPGAGTFRYRVRARNGTIFSTYSNWSTVNVTN